MAAQAPRRGRVLTMVGAGDVDHLDPALAYHTVTRGVVRAYTRQLVTYRSSRDRAATAVVGADLATEAKGPVDAEGRRYRHTLKDGVRWDAPSGSRAVTAQEVVRGIKASPARRPRARDWSPIQAWTPTMNGTKAPHSIVLARIDSMQKRVY